jgi:hypothetical protein
MAEGNAVSRATKWLIARYKSLPAIAMHALVANMFSTGDLASDLYTIENLFALGHNGPAYALLTMVCLSFVGQVMAWMRCVRRVPLIETYPRGGCGLMGSAPQVLLAVVLKKHLGPFAVLKEVALVLTCLKPGVEVWHLAHGAEHNPGAPIVPKDAMLISKVSERVFESIPGSILTTVTLLNHANARSPSTLVSVIVACLATAFVATTVAYNKDTEAAGRHMFPALHGYAPLSKHSHLQPGLMLACVFRLAGSAQLIGRFMGNTPGSKMRRFCVLFVMHAAQVLRRTVRCMLSGIRCYHALSA